MTPVFTPEEMTEFLCEISPTAARIYAERVEYVEPEPEAPSDVPVELGYHMRADDDLIRLAQSRGLDSSGSKADLIETLLADDEKNNPPAPVEEKADVPEQFAAVFDTGRE